MNFLLMYTPDILLYQLKVVPNSYNHNKQCCWKNKLIIIFIMISYIEPIIIVAIKFTSAWDHIQFVAVSLLLDFSEP